VPHLVRGVDSGRRLGSTARKQRAVPFGDPGGRQCGVETVVLDDDDRTGLPGIVLAADDSPDVATPIHSPNQTPHR
jgi:hypothetical protein